MCVTSDSESLSCLFVVAMQKLQSVWFLKYISKSKIQNTFNGFLKMARVQWEQLIQEKWYINTDPFLHCIYTVMRLQSLYSVNTEQKWVSIYMSFFLCHWKVLAPLSIEMTCMHLWHSRSYCNWLFDYLMIKVTIYST